MGKLDQANECYTWAMAGEFQFAAEYEYFGDRFFEVAQYERALQSYEESIKLDPQNSSGFISMGNHFQEMKSGNHLKLLPSWFPT